MKIGILTYHSVYNFGANLQVYSTVEYLKNKGYDPLVINWVPEELEAGYNRSNPPEQAAAHNDFIRRNLPLTTLCRNDAEVVETIEENGIEAIIIGSDAVLQHHTFLSRVRVGKKGISIKEKRSNAIFPNPYWGSFIPYLKKKIPVSVMSASSQNARYKQIRGKLRKKIGKALQQFKVITVRDDWTRKMVYYLTQGQINPNITPDPVFAYNQNIPNQLTKEEIQSKFNLPENYILLSFKNKGVVNEDWLKSFDNEAKRHQYDSILLTMPGGLIFDNPPIKTISPPLLPSEWYALIRYASGYVGENMHPVVVALHNIVPFFSFDNYGIIRLKYFVNDSSSKIYDLLSRAGFLSNRISTLGKGYHGISPKEVIDGILRFDKERCEHFSLLQLDRYNKMMEEIIGL